MKNYQRRAREKLDDIINALHHEVLKKERVLTVSFSLTKKDSIQNTVIWSERSIKHCNCSKRNIRRKN